MSGSYYFFNLELTQ